MSWYCGSHDTSTVPGPVPSSREMMARLCARLPCEMTTPLGAEVDPEVYCRKQGATGSGEGATGGLAAAGGDGGLRVSIGTQARASGHVWWEEEEEVAALKSRPMSASCAHTFGSNQTNSGTFDWSI